MTLRQKVGVMVAVVGLGIFGFMVAATAAEQMTITIPIDTKTFGDPGSIHLLETIPGSVFGEPGSVCGVNIEGGNNRSEHPGNNMIITSNGDSVVAADFERAAFQTTPAQGTFTLGATVEILLELGTDGASSGGVVVVIECSPPPDEPTTTTTTTTIPDTSTSTTTTTTSIPTGVPSGLGPVEDGLSPLTTWTILIGAFLLVALLGWAWVHGGNRRQDDE